MSALTLFKNIFREILKTPKSSLFYRLYYEIAKKFGWFYLRFLITNPSKIELAKVINLKTNNLLDYFRQRNNPKFFIDWRQKNIYQNLWLNQFSNKKERLIQLADEICLHKIDVFNSKSFYWDKSINWYLSPQVQKNWPLKHWSFINVNNPEMGDIKYCWQLNRHQHFYILGRAYWISGDEKYAKEFVDEFRDWVKKNPPEIGVNWVSSLEIAIRLISWTFGFYFFLDSKYFDEGFLRDYLKSIFIAARHIEKNLNLSRYCIANDHLIGEASVLFLVGTLFPEFKRAKKWQKTGGQILWPELKRQVFSDGVYFLYSVNYQRFVMEWYLMAVKIAELNNIKVPAEVKSRLEKMNQFIASLMSNQGIPPVLGENDGSKLLKFGYRFNDFRIILEDISMLIKEKPAFDNNLVFEETFWLFGPEYLENKKRNHFLPISQKEKFPEGGYYILTRGDDKLIFHCGNSRNGYGQTDMLHFDLMIGDEYVLLDNGTYLYNAEKKWRDYFKGTKSHNTIVVDDLDQMINWRKFKWLRPTKARLIKFTKTPNGGEIEGGHYGYTRLKNPVIHNRKIFWEENKITITDTLQGKGVHKLDLYFHFPKSDYDFDEKTGILNLKIKEKIIKATPKNQDFKSEVKIGSENPISGWSSPEYGVKEPCISLKYSKTKQLPESFITILSISNKK